MKTISIVICCYNELANVVPMYEAVTDHMASRLPQYGYELIFIDNCSTDGTRDRVRLLCARDSRVKAILNARNFGQFNSPYHGLCEATGDCAVLMCCDFQDPVELIETFVEAWEQGYLIVCGIKTASDENRALRWLRTRYYRAMQSMSEINQIEHFTGFGLYDDSVLDVMRNLDDPTPFLRGIVAELGFRRKDVPYTQRKRRSGKTHNGFGTLYDAAMLSFTSYTKSGLRSATLLGCGLGIASLIAAVVFLVLMVLEPGVLPAGPILLLLVVLVLGSAQLFYLGLMGEYVMSVNTRVMHRPLVIEQERLNFECAQPDASARVDAQQRNPLEDGRATDGSGESTQGEGR